MGRVLFYVGVILFLATGCKQSADVVSDSWIQKQKHRKVWFVDQGAHRNKSLEGGRAVQSIDRPALTADIEQKRPGISTIVKRPSLLMTRKTPIERELKEQSQGTVQLSWSEESLATLATVIPSNEPVEPEEPEEQDKTHQRLSIFAKILTGFSAFLAMGVTGVLIVVAAGAGLTPLAVAMLAIFALASLFGILVAALVAYILMVKYDDYDTIQWPATVAYTFYLFFVVLPWIILLVAAGA